MHTGYDINNRILTGRKSKSDGDFFERMIDEACERYKFNDKAFIEKTPEPMKPLRPFGKGQFVAHFVKHAQPDYKGTFEGGRAIVFEAKMTSSDRITQDRVSEWQMDSLKLHQHYGAIAFILVYFMTENSTFRIPIEVWIQMKELFKRKYLKPEDIREFEVPTTGMSVDFLSEIKSAEGII